MKVRTILSVFVLAFASSAFAGDSNAGKAIYSARCFFCHGQNGISASPSYPNLAGQKDQYVAQQLKDFRAKTRMGTVMNGMAENLTDADISNLATYLSTLSGCGN
ncbi:MAG: cytochrome c [Oligoflexia bacterium]|nr:cytochrome c [Oligoflexia bacterium]